MHCSAASPTQYRHRSTTIGTLILLLWLHMYSAAANTLQQHLDRAIQSFGQGDYNSSYWHFEQIELDYGETTQFLNRKFQQTILPVRAYAALMADRPTDALLHFGALLSQYTPHPNLRAFALYNAAIAQSQTQALAAAAQTFHNFQLTFPDSDEAALAQLQEADLRYAIGEIPEAVALLDELYASDASASLRMQGRLRALQIAADSNSSERICAILFDTDWQLSAMPDIAVLSFAALNAGDQLLNNGDYNAALRAYRLALPRAILRHKQRERLNALQQQIAAPSPFSSSIDNNHRQQLAARLTQQMEHLEQMPDYTPGLYLRAGHAYLLGQRFREATMLFRKVARSPEFEPQLRGEAYYRWTVTRCEAEDWAGARACAQLFISEQPRHPLAPNALFLVAHAYQAERRFADAVQVLQQLITNFPDAPQAPRWHFTLGYNYCLLEQLPQARATLASALERFPDSDLAEQIELWHALSYFFERDYRNSLDALRALQQKTAQHPLHPEVLFRIAHVYYAQREYQTALQSTKRLIHRFSEHPRVPEAQALRGDILMALGELDRAVQAFKQVPPETARLYDYATFQTGKIYRALKRYDLLRNHLQAYVDRDDASERPRVSEALYWIGWSLQQQARSEQALPIYEQALKRFGNDPAAEAVDSMLSAYAKLYHDAAAKATDRCDFDSWLQRARAQSLEDRKLCWFARLVAFKAERQRHTSGTSAAEATLLLIHRVVPIEQQAPATLASVGLALANRGYASAEAYFEHLLRVYPKRGERASAYYGKAQLAAKQQSLEAARRWLMRLLTETPAHPLATEARLLNARLLSRQQQYDCARAALNEILQTKHMRGRPHARALAELARIEMQRDMPRRAIAYWQRIYTLYRAYPEMIIEAYWHSAQLFEAIGDPVAARNTLRELLSDARLKDFEVYQRARAKLPALETLAQTAQAPASQPSTSEQMPQ